jgi:hypothetical protein
MIGGASERASAHRSQKIAHNMHQDIFVVHDTHDEILEFAMHNLSPEERLETKVFLTELLTEPIDLK